MGLRHYRFWQLSNRERSDCTCDHLTDPSVIILLQVILSIGVRPCKSPEELAHRNWLTIFQEDLPCNDVSLNAFNLSDHVHINNINVHETAKDDDWSNIINIHEQTNQTEVEITVEKKKEVTIIAALLFVTLMVVIIVAYAFAPKSVRCSLCRRRVPEGAGPLINEPEGFYGNEPEANYGV